MSIASLLISIAALALSLFAVITSFKFARRAESRESERHERERRADLEIVEAYFDRMDGKVADYPIKVRNIGAGAARRVNVVIVDGENIDPIGEPAHEFYVSDTTITPGETKPMVVQLGMALWSRSLRFRLFWSDAAGDHEADGPMCPRDRHPVSGSALIRWPWEPPRNR